MDIYEELRQVLDTHPTGAPKSKYFDEILRIMFSPEEAAIAAKMTFAPRTVEHLATATGVEVEKLKTTLEAMANKMAIYSAEKSGQRLYGLLPTIPGLFEFPFMKGGGTPELEKLGQLWENYHNDAMGAKFGETKTVLMRVVPVVRSIDSKNQVHPYEEVAKLIEKSSFISVSECACRVSVHKCDAPKDVCLIFDTPGKFLVQRGYAREITKEEAMRVLDRVEKAGLIHTSNNSIEKANMICNCCPCCCTVLRGRTELNLPHAFNPSGFVAAVDKDDCSGCAICAEERCPMSAIDMVDDIAVVSEARCVGCGLCVSTCPSEAIKLARRSVQPEICASTQEMGMKVGMEKGTLAKFIEIMKR